MWSQNPELNEKVLSASRCLPERSERDNPHVDIFFRNITYSVDAVDDQVRQSPFQIFKHYTEKVLLNNVSGIFKAGKLTAIMGASGAGKTTLLNIIACRVEPQHVSGNYTANSKTYTYETFGAFASYVIQKDSLIQTLTVRETLTFAAVMVRRRKEELNN